MTGIAPFHSLEVEDGIALLRIERPARLNALHPEAHWALAETFDPQQGNAVLDLEAVKWRNPGHKYPRSKNSTLAI